MLAVQRSAIITGGTGGLGRAVVAAFVADGWRVLVPDVAPAELEGAEVVKADLTDAGEAARVVERAGAPLHALVNLVGGVAADQPVATTPQWRPSRPSSRSTSAPPIS
jgi:NAD(P)-dependent dehydrogenase (short-subunit alcohol dehydrogenase family)